MWYSAHFLVNNKTLNTFKNDSLVEKLKYKVIFFLKCNYDILKIASDYIIPSKIKKRKNLERMRDKADKLFASIVEKNDQSFSGNVVIDGFFDNPNFWYRLMLIRAGLGLHKSNELGVTGDFNVKKCQRSFNTIGISNIINLKEYYIDRNKAKHMARILLANTKSAKDVLTWELPFDFPAEQAYDAILKWQRQAEVNISDPRLLQYITTGIQKLYAADILLKKSRCTLLLISQPLDFDEGALGWIAAQNKIKTIVVTGHGGLSRLRKSYAPERLFVGGDTPSVNEMNLLNSQQLESLKNIGFDYLGNRVNGKINDLGAQYAYVKNNKSITRDELTQKYDWDADKKIVIVYAANWFDYPHAFGMSNFVDFLDWIKVTLKAAENNTSVNWLFKSHPCDAWYGGVTLADLLPKKLPKHIQLCPDHISSKDLILSVDVLVTAHGTSGIEYAFSEKPVLVADKGWYHDFGFVKYSTSRDAYINNLAKNWWQDIDVKQAKDLSGIYAGLLYCCPDWQNRLITGDDPQKGFLYAQYHELCDNNIEELKFELQSVKDWYESDTEGFHTYKMSQASAYQLANIIS